MVEQIQKKLSDSAGARWAAVLIVSFTMMMGYFLTDVMSPLQDMLETPIAKGGFGLGWSSSEYGFFAGSYGIINVFLLMLFFSGIILDKLGVRFTGVLASSLMVIGAFLKFYSLQFISPEQTLSILGVDYKLQVWIASLGFAIFGVGCEMCGITVSKIIAKWFSGYSMALAMGIQVGMARLGTAGALGLSPIIAHHYNNVASPVLFGAILLFIGLLAFLVYVVMDTKLNKSIAALRSKDYKDEEGFKFSDLKAILTNPGFWLIALLCLLFYSAVFPFLKFATKLMIAKYNVNPDFAGMIPAILPFGTIFLTPIFGSIYDRVGKGATLMIIGSVLLTAVHICFALPILDTGGFAIFLMVLLGIAFALVPSAMWPSMPKIIPMKQLGSAYAITFYIQNIGLTLVPMLIGNVLQSNTVGTKVNFTSTMWIFASFGIISIALAVILRILDSKKHYGLEEANIKK
ncbi:MFS transporter [Prevotella cerevisiae]|jgi:MFS family permease|uniref:Lysosomal dipeptide transporter MFSD1 n=1 Tax=Segatella cerevisiae TaxID=2053716 RepID=A0ABT1BVR1_9BACT|nr:MFS transporter [Segatella cerevisiae]MCH3993888.1 MFS transporter [Prevotella sp.]MCO6025170.1 MFS transporter [Segatella cerevisiae]